MGAFLTPSGPPVHAPNGGGRPALYCAPTPPGDRRTFPPGAAPLEHAGPGRGIVIRGAREHNLKDVSLTLPRNRLVVITGVSGSGKSSLAFDTLYAEGQRRYVESLSAYARQFLGQMEK